MIFELTVRLIHPGMGACAVMTTADMSKSHRYWQSPQGLSLYLTLISKRRVLAWTCTCPKLQPWTCYLAYLTSWSSELVRCLASARLTIAVYPVLPVSVVSGTPGGPGL